jgi:hypothetical protein
MSERRGGSPYGNDGSNPTILIVLVTMMLIIILGGLSLALFGFGLLT